MHQHSTELIQTKNLVVFVRLDGLIPSSVIAIRTAHSEWC
ncbi:hypothetical protein SynROS8604_03586 [Synechococcus sp. ROS8604]|nr:hypothetical protein SynROS8604_03586 [Synechococcus sp. ROS8604]